MSATVLPWIHQQQTHDDGAAHGEQHVIADPPDLGGSHQPAQSPGAVTHSVHRAIDALPFDTEVHDNRKQEIKKGGRFEARRDLAGGTCFTAVMDHAREHRKEYDGIIIFTDGYAPDPGPPRRGQRRCWLISSGGKMTFDPHPGDTVIKLDGINNPKNK